MCVIALVLKCNFGQFVHVYRASVIDDDLNDSAECVRRINMSKKREKKDQSCDYFVSRVAFLFGKLGC